MDINKEEALWNLDYWVDKKKVPYDILTEKQSAKQIKEMIKLFHSPLGHMTKYNPEEEWIRIK